MIWLYALAGLALLLFVAHKLLFDRQGNRIYRLNLMQVRCVDEDGEVVSSSWHWIKKPDRYPENGMAHIGPYVERLVAFNGWSATIMMFTLDDMRGFSLAKIGGPVTVEMIIAWRDEPEREKAARAFFASLGIEPIEDYLAGNGDVPDASRCLSWQVEGDAESLTGLCRQVLLELCSVEQEEGLNITYREIADYPEEWFPPAYGDPLEGPPSMGYK